VLIESHGAPEKGPDESSNDHASPAAFPVYPAVRQDDHQKNAVTSKIVSRGAA